MQKVLYQRKTVQVTVYVVKPRKSRNHSSNAERHSGRRHERTLPCSGSGYDRKSQLLLYSRMLRATAWQESSDKPHPQNKVKAVHFASSHKPQQKVKESLLQIASTINHKPQHTVSEVLQMTSSHNPQHKAKEVRKITHTCSWKVVPIEQKPAQAKLPRPPPSCFGDWKKLFLPGFLVRGVKLRARKDERERTKKKSVSITDKINAIMMSSKMKKERIGAMAKFLSAIGKRS